MIVTETVETEGKVWPILYHTYSDLGVFIENEDGVQYSEAFDFAADNHTYTETNVQIDSVVEDYALNPKESEAH